MKYFLSTKNMDFILTVLLFQFERCRHVELYEKLDKIGQGTYGDVYRARDTESNEIVALKRMRIEKFKDGLPESTTREINLLKSLDHLNIVKFIEVVVGPSLDSIFLVMEYCEHDLGELVDHETNFTESQIKCIMQQLFTGLSYLHRNHIVHRDIKASNLLLTNDGQLKIADFGLARKYSYPSEPMTPGVVTRWYRAPELLFEAEHQTSAIDMWAAGCIFGELYLQKPLLPGTSEIHQIELIIDLIGTPNDKIWPGFSDLPVAQAYHMKQQPYNNVAAIFTNVSSSGIQLLNMLLMYDPRRRATAEESLESSYFKESPLRKLILS